MNQTIYDRSVLKRRIKITGRLVFDTAFHIGGEASYSGTTDNPILRDAYGRPFIPGSSIKGAMRAAVERIVTSLGLSACQLFDKDQRCLTPFESSESPRREYETIANAVYRSAAIQFKEEVNTLLRNKEVTFDNLPDKDRKVSEAALLFLLEHTLCDVCKTFGSPFMSSSIFFHDCSVISESWIRVTQIRNGVAIDRDSGRAKNQLLYDFEVVPPQTAFNFSLTIESDHPVILGIVAIGLHELLCGNIRLGGIKSRGLGCCKLERDANVEIINLDDTVKLLSYFRGEKSPSQDIHSFIEGSIRNLFETERGQNVQNTAK